jgi:transposase
MDRGPLPDLNSLDRDALVAMVLVHQVQLASQQDELRSLQAELDSHRQTVFQQAEELRSRSQRIEHMKLMIEKLRRMVFGSNVAGEMFWQRLTFRSGLLLKR